MNPPDLIVILDRCHRCQHPVTALTEARVEAAMSEHELYCRAH